MRRVAEDVFQTALSPRDGVNAYLLGDVVVDAGDSARRLAALEPDLVLLGHGAPLRDPTVFKGFADALPK